MNPANLDARKREKPPKKRSLGLHLGLLGIAFPLCLAMLFLTGCNAPAPTAKEKVYDVKGKVMALEPENKKIKLDHEEIPGFMEPMKMYFNVQDAKILDGLSVGDSVQGRLKVLPDQSYFITELKKR